MKQTGAFSHNKIESEWGVALEKELVLKMKDISKAFPGVKALNQVHFELRKGEVHALVGENGAGKSTLMKILSGLYHPDEGTIEVEGKEVHFRDPRDAEHAGISIVYQELSNFPDMSIAENIMVGRMPVKGLKAIDYGKMNQITQELLDEFELHDLEPELPVRNLSIGRQQIVEILKAISGDAKVIIFDEPTSALTTHETELMFQNIRRLQKKGVSIIYISHRLEEIFEICDRVTVFRDGTYITTQEIAQTDKQELVRYMVGRDVAYEYGAHSTPVSGVLFEAEHISDRKTLKDVSFTLRAGEVLGIAGLEGAGRSELAEVLFGIRKRTGGTMSVEGKVVEINNARDAKRNGIAYLTKDRKRAGLFLHNTINENIMSVNLDRFAKHSFISYKEAYKNSDYYMKRFQIRSHSMDKMVVGLSGGNQQKVLLAMWFTRSPKIMIVDEPTRGIDVGAKEEIHRLLRQQAAKGSGIIIISSDLPELLGASDRIMVMHEGRVVKIIDNKTVSEETIVALASGL